MIKNTPYSSVRMIRAGLFESWGVIRVHWAVSVSVQ